MIRSDWGDLIKARQRQRRVKAKAVALPTELEDELTKVRGWRRRRHPTIRFTST